MSAHTAVTDRGTVEFVATVEVVAAVAARSDPVTAGEPALLPDDGLSAHRPLLAAVAAVAGGSLLADGLSAHHPPSPVAPLPDSLLPEGRSTHRPVSAEAAEASRLADGRSAQ